MPGERALSPNPDQGEGGLVRHPGGTGLEAGCPGRGLARVTYVEPYLIDAVWPDVEAMVERALRHGQGDEVTVDDIRQQAVDGAMGVLVVTLEKVVGVCVFRIVDAQVRKVWVDILAGVDLDSWADAIESALNQIKEGIGATCVEGSCRPGLARYLKRRGWRRKSIIMEYV